MLKKFSCGLAAVLLAAVLFSACGGAQPAKVESDELQFTGPVAGDTIAVFETNKGTFKAVLYPGLAPLAVENFVTNANNGYYDGMIFHRVVEDFIIQSGDPEGTGYGGQSIWGSPFADEFTDKLHNYTGALSMANSGEHTNRSQFFVVATPANVDDRFIAAMQAAGWREEVIETYKKAGGYPSLDYKHTVFGQVYEGLGVVLKISHVKVAGEDKPTTDIVIKKVTIETFAVE